SVDFRRSTVSCATMQLASTRLCGKRLNCWNTMPMWRLAPSMSQSRSVMSVPRTSTVPDSGCSSRWMHRRNVDFPEPDAPITQTTSPLRTEKSMPRSTWLSPNDLCRSDIPTTSSVVEAADIRTSGPCLQSTYQVREREGDEQVPEPGHDQRRQVQIRVRELATVLRQVVVLSGETDDVHQRRVLDEQDQLVGQRRQHRPKRLRQHDLARRLRRRHTECPGGLR